MNPKKYKELTGDVKGKKLINLRPTERGHVSIHEHEAERMNAKSHRTRLFYELAEESEGKPFEEMSITEINRLNATDAIRLAKEQGAEEELSGKESKNFLTKLKK